MKLSRLFGSLMLATVATAGAASAQIAPGRSGSSSMDYFSGAEAWLEVGTFGTCYARRNEEQALRLVATEPGSLEEAQVYKELFRKSNQSCLGSVTHLQAPHSMIRGGIAEGLYRTGVPLPAELALTTQTPSEVRNLSGAARCYVGRNPDDARTIVLTTRPGSRAEHEAVAAIMPKFRECLPEGINSQFSATLIRFRLAEALYRTGVSPVTVAENK